MDFYFLINCSTSLYNGPLKLYQECIENKCKYYKEALEAGTEAVHFGKKQEDDEMALSRIVRRKSK